MRATDINIAMPPKLKMEMRPHNCLRETLRLRSRMKGRRKTRLVGLRGNVLMRSDMMFVETDVKKTGSAA